MSSYAWFSKVVLAAATLSIAATGVHAQQATVSGRVIERGSRAAVSGATVQLEGRTPVLTGNDGGFRFAGVSPGRYNLTAEGLGWMLEDIGLVVRGDTTVIIELDRAPVQLDTLAVESRPISVRGVVTDAVSGVELIDAEVFTPPDRKTTTNPVGRFRFRNMPRNTPFLIQIQDLGYLPQSIAVVAAGDTTLAIALEADPIVSRMIDNAKQRLAERSEPRRYNVRPFITREDLLVNTNRSVWDVLEDLLRTRTRRIACIAIDEKVMSANRFLLDTMLPDRVEHIEIIEFGPRDSLMVRVYTRQYFPSLFVSSTQILSPDALLRAARMASCR